MRRLTSRHLVCPECKKNTLVPIDSPVGQKLNKEYKQPKRVYELNDSSIFKGISKDEALDKWRKNPRDNRNIRESLLYGRR